MLIRQRKNQELAGRQRVGVCFEDDKGPVPKTEQVCCVSGLVTRHVLLKTREYLRA